MFILQKNGVVVAALQQKNGEWIFRGNISYKPQLYAMLREYLKRMKVAAFALNCHNN